MKFEAKYFAIVSRKFWQIDPLEFLIKKVLRDNKLPFTTIILAIGSQEEILFNMGNSDAWGEIELASI